MAAKGIITVCGLNVQRAFVLIYLSNLVLVRIILCQFHTLFYIYILFSLLFVDFLL